LDTEVLFLALKNLGVETTRPLLDGCLALAGCAEAANYGSLPATNWASRLDLIVASRAALPLLRKQKPFWLRYKTSN
jgi:hypothetical protein